VDDESKVDGQMPLPLDADPRKYDKAENPPYPYWSYYLYANICSLNKLRRDRNLHELTFRPHCGEAGSVTHLADSFLLATNINHGIGLQKSMPLQYLYYLAQIGLAVSPLSNAALFLDYEKNPFSLFFKRGLFVSLSTDDPLQFSYTRFPLIEEYSVAKVRFNLSQVDMSEISANSVRQSGFEHRLKCQFLGTQYYRHGIVGNDVEYSNIPDLRVSYRARCLEEELSFVAKSHMGLFPIHQASSVNMLAPTVNSLFTKVSLTHVSKNASREEKDKKMTTEEQESCRHLLEMVKLRHKYLKPGNASAYMASLQESKSIGKLSRRYVQQDGVYVVLNSELELCSHDREELAQMLCLDCKLS
jgi:hypothetical protein